MYASANKQVLLSWATDRRKEGLYYMTKVIKKVLLISAADEHYISIYYTELGP